MQGRTVLGKYQIGREIGRGSMGQVFLAHPLSGGADVVVKFMNEHVASQPRFRELFAQEMEMMARFHHPQAVRLLGGDLDDPAGPCIVMEYVDGVDMAELLKLERRLDENRLAKLIVPLCQALHAAHMAGIIHRDLKPANIKVQNPGESTESCKVMDLGLAALALKPYIPFDKLNGSTDAHLVGSPAYMCPEQIRGDNVDHRGDIYSLGVVLYEVLTGRMPFEDDEIMALLNAHTQQQPPRFADLGIDDVNYKVEDVVFRCLEKYANERPQTAFEVAVRFRAALGIEEPLEESDFAPFDTSDQNGVPPVGKTSDRIVQSMTAWMPEQIALIKLRGFMLDLGTRLLESAPGLIRVQLGELPKPELPQKGLMKWFRKPPPPVEPDPVPPVLIDLHLTKKPGMTNRVEITTAFRALEGPLPDDKRWHERSHKLFTDLQSYLMAQR